MHFTAMHPDQLARSLQDHIGGHEMHSGVQATMHEFKHGTLKSGSGHPVESKAQALAIGLHEEREAKEGKP